MSTNEIASTIGYWIDGEPRGLERGRTAGEILRGKKVIEFAAGSPHLLKRAYMENVNVPIPEPVAHHYFGGWKSLLFGGTAAYGVRGFDFFTRERATIGRWIDPATRGGTNLGFPQNN